MPLARYFLYVGGVLLTLLFILDACLTKLPVTESMEKAQTNLPVIRIHSDRKWPERIVFDTSLPTIVPAPTAIAEDRVPGPGKVADVSAKEREREAFALMQTDPGKRELKGQRQRKIAKRHVMPRSVVVARQPRFGWFGNMIW
jgi:hypothetical protein